MTSSPLSRRRVLGGGAAAAVGTALGLGSTAGPAAAQTVPRAAEPTTSQIGLGAGPHALLTHAVWGAYASGEPYPSCDSHFALERSVGSRLPWMSWFFTWSVSWPTAAGAQAAAGGYDVLVAWQPQKDDGTPIPFADILAGAQDDYLTRFFTKAAAHPGRVMIRFAHEMNGAGYPWSLGYRDGRSSVASTAEFVRTWRYVVDVQRRVGGDNVEFLWCITASDKGGVPAEQYYPGHEWVDALGMDLYNGYGGWAQPRGVISATYRRLAAIHPTMPIWVAELGCREPSIREASGAAPVPGASKAAWLEALFAVTEFPRITNVNFFHASRSYDWRISSTATALATVKSAFARRASMAATLRAW